MPLSETEIKSQLLQFWRERGIISRSTVIASEYTLGTNGRRIDIAFATETLVGVEIKSDSDSLDRLADQISVYEHCFDRVIVACGSRHLQRCLAETGDHVEVWEIDDRDPPRVAREALASLEPDTAIMVRSLTVEQLRRIIAANRDLSRSELLKLASELPRHTIRQAQLEFFTNRFAKSSCDFWKSVAQRKIRVTDVASLSRFSESRIRQAQLQDARSEFWLNWQHSANLAFS